MQPIVDVAHLVHGPIACEGNSWDNRHAASSGSTLYRTGFTTDINELDVIYGGEKRLFKSVREIIEKYDPRAVFVYQTCVTALIGDDIEAVCKRASEKFGKPVIPVNSPGFAGPKNLGNKLGGEAIQDVCQRGQGVAEKFLQVGIDRGLAPGLGSPGTPIGRFSTPFIALQEERRHGEQRFVPEP